MKKAAGIIAAISLVGCFSQAGASKEPEEFNPVRELAERHSGVEESLNHKGLALYCQSLGRSKIRYYSAEEFAKTPYFHLPEYICNAADREGFEDVTNIIDHYLLDHPRATLAEAQDVIRERVHGSVSEMCGNATLSPHKDDAAGEVYYNLCDALGQNPAIIYGEKLKSRMSP